MSRKTQCLDNCNALANQYMVLVAIFASLLSQEIEDDEDLGILGSFLIALGEELSLASEIRILCKSKLEKNKNNIDTEIRSEEHTSELQSRQYLVCCLLLE